ncbi:MAG: hypothetical protein ACFFHV_12000 [Promethearchaeota archaeon]
MNQITPAKLYQFYKTKKINKSEFINRIITMYEFSDSEKIRIECLKTLESVNIKTEKVFKFLEEVVISDPNIEVRLNAVSLALKKFPEKGYNLVNYLFNSCESREFITRIAKIIGETMISSNNNITAELSNSLQSMILNIFETEDVKSFEILWGDWFYKVPGDFWEFLLELKAPIGMLEIMDYFTSNHKIYEWFYKYLFVKFNFEQWLLFFSNSRFSGRFFYFLSFLEEEKPSIRFYQLFELFERFGKNFSHHQINEIKSLIKGNNQYTLALILIFHWFHHFDVESLKFTLEDADQKLFLKISEMVMSTKFGFLEHDHYLYSFLLFLLKICKEIDEKYILKFFKEISPIIRKNFILKLFKILNDKEGHKNYKSDEAYFIKIKASISEFLKILSKYYDIEFLNS